jgi:hypothetical protein
MTGFVSAGSTVTVFFLKVLQNRSFEKKKIVHGSPHFHTSFQSFAFGFTPFYDWFLSFTLYF